MGGENANGELGNNSFIYSNVPVAVDQSGALNGKSIISICGGGEHCLAVSADGVLAGWGSSQRGQLGNNLSGSDSPAPTLASTIGFAPGERLVRAYTRCSALHTLALVASPAKSNYSEWARINANSQSPSEDYDQDGIDNGIEFFMNSGVGSTANPNLVNGVITWPNGGKIPPSAYGSQFIVQTSSDLSEWADVQITDSNLSNTNVAVSYTLQPGAGRCFVRFIVTPD